MVRMRSLFGKLSLLLTLLITSLPLSPVWAADEGTAFSSNIWHDKYTQLENSIYSYYESKHSSDLGWGASYQLRSHINMYRVTKDTAWLDKLVHHADTMIANADDNDGDGFRGWGTWGYSPVELTNIGFETADPEDNTLPAGWTRKQGTKADAYRSAEAAHNGTSGLVLKSGGDQAPVVVQKLDEYVPATQYNVRFYTRTNHEDTSAVVKVVDLTSGKVLHQISENKTNFYYSSSNFFTPEEAGHEIEIQLTLQSGQADSFAHFDEVKVSGWFPYIVHDAMISIPLAEFDRLVKQTPELQAKYGEKADAYVRFIAENIIPRWERSDYLGNCWVNVSPKLGYYRFPKMDTSGENSALIEPAYNYNASMAHLYILMYNLTKDPFYRDRYIKIGNYLKGALETEGDSYIWRYWSRPGSYWEDTSHGNIEIGAFLEYYRNGIMFTGDDMRKFKNRFTDYMWNGSLEDPKVSRYIDGTGSDVYSTFLMNWSELSQFDMIVWKITSEMYKKANLYHPLHLLVLSSILKWDPESVVNSDFELDDGSGKPYPAHWTIHEDKGKVYLDKRNAKDGRYGLTIHPANHSQPTAVQQWTGWKPSTAYRLTLDGKVTGKASGGKAIIRNASTQEILAEVIVMNHREWQKFSTEFVTPADANVPLEIVLTVEGKKQSAKVHFDNVDIYPR